MNAYDDAILRAELVRLVFRVQQLMAGRKILPTDQMIDAIVERHRKIAADNTTDKRDWGDVVRFDEARIRAEAVADLAVALPIIGIEQGGT